MADLSPRQNHELMRLLTHLGWGPERLAAEVNAAVGGGHAAINKTTPYHWRDRGRVPRPPYDQVVCEVLSRALGIAVTYQQLWSAMGPARGARTISARLLTDAWTPEFARAALVEAAAAGAPVRLQRPADLFRPEDLHLVARQWADSECPPPVGHGPLPVGPAHVAELRGSADGKDRLEMAFGGGLVLETARREVGVLVQLLELGAYDERTGRELYAVAARLARLAGWAASDGCDEVTAQRCFVAALRAAHVSGDVRTGASVMGCLAAQATFLPGREREAVTLLTMALAAADGVDGAAERALQYGRMARALGRLGERPGAEEAAERAFTEAAAGDADPQDLADLHKLVGESLLFLGRPKPARHHLELAAAGIAPERARTRALALVRLAECLLLGGRRAAAVEAADRARELAAGMLSVRVAKVLKEFDRACRP
ncbi:hypothetical protein ACIQGZ_17925 [Streptomyces sp. NPDC092296]|uniref:hypothetical protein n=1 Tax=Streptomyces sp. NPDC092296 TaxID=3366012 RepID=UPI0038247914